MFSGKVKGESEKIANSEYITQPMGNDHEVKFHEIEIHFFMRSKLNLFMRSNYFVTFHEVKIPNNDSISWSALFHEIEIQKSIIRQFQSHDQFVSYKYDHEVEIQNKLFKFSKLHLWLILALIISHLCIKTFDLMIALAANKSIMRSKFTNNASFWVSISWSIF